VGDLCTGQINDLLTGCDVQNRLKAKNLMHINQILYVLSSLLKFTKGIPRCVFWC